MRHGIIFKATDETTRFITPSGRMYIWAYGAWRFKAQIHESMYTSIRSIAGRKGSKVFVARSRKVFMDKRVALDPIDYFAVEFMGHRFSKGQLFRNGEIARVQQNAAVSFGKAARQRLTGSDYFITPTPFYVHKIRPPKIHK